MYLPTLETLNNIPTDYKYTVLYKEINEDSLTPISVLKKISQKENVFLLESANLDKTFSRFSFFCYNPKRIIKYSDGTLKVKDLQNNIESSKQITDQNFIAYINSKNSSKNKIFSPDLFGDFKGGFVGFFSYESVNLMNILRKKIITKDEQSEDYNVPKKKDYII